MDALIRIGRFAQITQISATALRLYDEIGILCPAVVNQDTGYRYYGLEQLAVAETIRLLRDIDVPLADIRKLLQAEGRYELDCVLRTHRNRVQMRELQARRICARIDRILDRDHTMLPYDFELTVLEPQRVVSARTAVPVPEQDEATRKILDELMSRLPEDADTAELREVVLYHQPLRWYEALDYEVCLPIAGIPGHIDSEWELQGGLAARTVHHGSWDDIWGAYASLMSWIERQGLVRIGPMRESYLIDNRDTSDPSHYVTEIAWLVSES